MKRNILIRGLFVALVVGGLVAPEVASAAKIIRGFSMATVENSRYVNVTLMVKGPLQGGEYYIGWMNRKKIIGRKKVVLEPMGADAYLPVTVSLSGRELQSPQKIGMEGPEGHVGTYAVRFAPGPSQQAMFGKRRKTKTIQTWYERREQDLKLAWVDDGEEHLGVEFFEKATVAGEELEVRFRKGDTIVCGDTIALNAVKGQVVRARAHCRKDIKDDGAHEDDGVVVSDDSHFYDDDLSDADLDAGAVNVKNALKVEEALEEDANWSVEIRRGKKIVKSLRFKVKDGELKTGVNRAGPMKAVKVKMGK